MMRKTVLLSLAIVLILGVPAFAGECPICKFADSTDYREKVPGMVARGAANIGLGWYEIIDHTIERSQNEAPIIGTFIGLGEGTIAALDRMGRGVIDVVGALVPGYNGAAPTRGWPCPVHEGGPQMPPAQPAAARSAPPEPPAE